MKEFVSLCLKKVPAEASVNAFHTLIISFFLVLLGIVVMKRFFFMSPIE